MNRLQKSSACNIYTPDPKNTLNLYIEKKMILSSEEFQPQNEIIKPFQATLNPIFADHEQEKNYTCYAVGDACILRLFVF